MVQFAIFLTRLFRRPIALLGVDYNQFEVLLRTKLTIDTRSEPGAFRNTGDKKRTFVFQLIFFAIYGLLIGLVIFYAQSLTSSLTLFFTVLIVLLGITLISEFTTVLFDHRDNQIILPRPVSHRTLLFLRIAHIQFYTGYIALAFSLATGVIIFIKYNISAGLLFFLAAGLCSWLTLESTTFIYLFISRIVEGEKFKDILTYLQIITAVIIYTGYQFLTQTSFMKNAESPDSWWNYLLPPYWFAYLTRITENGNFTARELTMSVLAVAMPVAGAIVLIKFLSAGFEKILAAASAENLRKEEAQVVKRVKAGNIFRQLLCISPAEKAGWDFAMATTRRDRKFKQSVYPFIGIMFVFAFFTLKPALEHTTIREISIFQKIIFILITGYGGSAAILQLQYTDTPNAGWLFQSMPLGKHGQLLTGAVKAMLTKFYLPFHLVIFTAACLLWGISIIPQAVLGLSGTVFLSLVVVYFNGMKLPFTESREMQNKGSMSITAIFMMFLLLITGGLIYATTFLPSWVPIVLTGGFIYIIISLFSVIGNRSYKM